MDIEVRIRGLMMDPSTNMPIVVLKDVKSEAVMPIWVGIFEANAIALALRAECPIFVAEKVMETAKLNTSGPPEGPTAEQLRGWLEGLNDEDLGRYKM